MTDIERTKLTVAIPTAELDDMRARATLRGITATELLRRSVAVYKALFDDNPDCKVLIEHPDGHFERLLLG